MTTLDLITRGDLEQFKIELFEELKKLQILSATVEAKEWLKSAEVRRLLKISPGTLQNLRINGTLSYTRIGGLIYYRYAGILKVLEANTIESIDR